MPRLSLNSSVALSATCPPKKRKIDLWDTTVTGFVLEVRAGGGRTWALRFVDVDGVQRQHKIGRFEDITFEQAKRQAIKLRSAVILGGNPAGEKEARKAIPTYASLCAQHLAHAKAHLRRPDGIERIMRCHLLPRWGRRRLNQIRSQDIALWLGEKAEEGLKPATVEKIRVVLSRSYELARGWGVPGAEINPVRGVPRRSFSNARHRYLSEQEAARLLQACETSLNPQLKAIVSLLLLTGARVSELLNAKWRHVDVERRTWLIEKTKSGKARHVPLSQAACDIIQQLPRFDGCPYLIMNPETKTRFVSFKQSWQSARKSL